MVKKRVSPLGLPTHNKKILKNEVRKTKVVIKYYSFKSVVLPS